MLFKLNIFVHSLFPVYNQKIMETLNPPQPDATIVTATNLVDSTIEQHSPQTNDDVETEDSFSNTQNSTEESTEENENKIEPVNGGGGQESQHETTAIEQNEDEQQQQSEREEKEVEDEEKEEPMDISADNDAVGINESEDVQPQQVSTEQQPQMASYTEAKETSDELNAADETPNEILKFQYAKEDADNEEELLKSDEDEEQKDDEPNGNKVSAEFSMEQEDALLKSDDDDDDGEQTEEPKLSPIHKQNDSSLNKYEEDMEEGRSSSKDNRSRNDNEDSLEPNENTAQEVKHPYPPASPSFAHAVQSAVIKIDDDDSHSNVPEKSISPKIKERKNSANHRILYKFDLDDDSSQESHKSKRSKMETSSPINQRRTSIENVKESIDSIREEGVWSVRDVYSSTVRSGDDEKSMVTSPSQRIEEKTLMESPVAEEKSMNSSLPTVIMGTDNKINSNNDGDDIDTSSNQSFESNSVSETTDVQDINQQQSTTRNEEDINDEAMTSSAAVPPSPHSLANEQLVEHSEDKETTTAILAKVTKRWNSFDNSYHSTDEILPRRNADGDEAIDRENGNEICSQSPKLNGDHSPLRNEQEEEYNMDDNSNDSVQSRNDNSRSTINDMESLPQVLRTCKSPLNLPQNEEARIDFPNETAISKSPQSLEQSEDNGQSPVLSPTETLCKSRKTSLDSSQPPFMSPTSPRNLPQNEEARIDFHNETNPEAVYAPFATPPMPAVSVPQQGSEQKQHPGNDDDVDDDEESMHDSDNETDLKINEETQEIHQNSNENHRLPAAEECLNSTLPINENDDASRSSVASSASYSTNTSSSQQLVIDHPMDDIKEEKVKPLKISLKRKLSYSSEEGGGHSRGPQHKQIHLSGENDEVNGSVAENNCEQRMLTYQERPDQTVPMDVMSPTKSLSHFQAEPLFPAASDDNVFVKTEASDFEQVRNLKNPVLAILKCVFVFF